jgi:hypothetical protein
MTKWNKEMWNDREKKNMRRRKRGESEGKGKGKGKGHPRTGHEGPEGEKMYSSTLPSTSALGTGGWSTPRHAPAALPPGKTRYPFYRRLGGPQGRFGLVRKIAPPLPGFDPQTVQPAASRYTDWAIPALGERVGSERKWDKWEGKKRWDRRRRRRRKRRKRKKREGD